MSQGHITDNPQAYQLPLEPRHGALANVRIVMIRTSLAANIGSAARAMKTMGLSALELVAPRNFPDPEASALASGADDVLANARVHPTFDAAIADAQLVIGSSARRRELLMPELTPAQAAKMLIEAAARGPVAMVFGNERTGMENVELERCHYLTVIPTVAEFSSLNVAQAIQLYCYELHCAALAQPALDDSPRLVSALGEDQVHSPASAQVLEGFFEHLETTLNELEFLDPQNPRQMMRRLRRLYQRAQPDQSEIHMLRGILAALGKKARAMGSRRR